MRNKTKQKGERKKVVEGEVMEAGRDLLEVLKPLLRNPTE